MHERVALDSNVLAAMFFKEEASSRALNAATKPDLITLDLSFVEVGNVAWKRVVLGGEDSDLAQKALKECRIFIRDVCDVVKAQDLVPEAYEISIGIRASFYDSLFLALAEKEHVPILTLDKKLYNKAKVSHDVQLI